MNKEDLKNLATLARIDMADAELEELSKEFDGILEYVAQISEVAIDTGEGTPHVPAHHNIMREDEGAHEARTYSEDIIGNMPDTERGYLKVKKIL